MMKIGEKVVSFLLYLSIRHIGLTRVRLELQSFSQESVRGRCFEMFQMTSGYLHTKAGLVTCRHINGGKRKGESPQFL